MKDRLLPPNGRNGFQEPDDLPVPRAYVGVFASLFLLSSSASTVCFSSITTFRFFLSLFFPSYI